MKRKLVASLAIAVFAILGLIASVLVKMSPATAQVPPLITYQGFLTTAAKVPINATLQITFKFYAASSGGAPLWAETQSVAVSDGIFNVVLGSVTPIPLPFASPYYLGITVGADPEMTPRQPLSSVPYAMRAGCNPGDIVTCYTGAPGTAGNGLCTTGARTCNAQGTGWSACAGEVVPNCGTSCFNFQTDPAHCGTCGNPCAAGMVCSSGQCAAPICGDGVKQGAETCDDGNAVNGDGCSSNCQQESGYMCVGTPSICSAVCGDSIIAGAEQCDGPNLNGATCQTFGFSSGSLSCTQSCQINTSACVQ